MVLCVRGHFMRALIGSAIVGGVTLALIVWAHHLTAQQRNGGLHWYGALVLLWATLVVVILTLWTIAAVATARRVELTRPILTVEAVLAVALTAAMVVMVGATAVWWAAMAKDAPGFLSTSPGGTPGSPWDLLARRHGRPDAPRAGCCRDGCGREWATWATMRSD